jgi:hypothetical protein
MRRWGRREKNKKKSDKHDYEIYIITAAYPKCASLNAVFSLNGSRLSVIIKPQTPTSQCHARIIPLAVHENAMVSGHCALRGVISLDR